MAGNPADKSADRRRRLLWMLAAGLLCAAGYGAFRVYFVSTDVALRHAEAFLFRRMSVAQLAEHGEYRFFYASNRAPADPMAEVINDRFSDERRDQLTFGAFDARIQPALGLGMLINPTEWLQDEEIDLLDIHHVERQRFAGELRDAVRRSPHRALLIVLHGYREAYESALRKTAFLGHVLDVDAPLLLFDWPGNQGGSLRGYRRAHRIASESGEQLAQLLQLLVNEVLPDVPGARLWLLANSMGAQVVVDAFSVLHQDPALADPAAELAHVVLTAPDVDMQSFDERFRSEIAALAEQLTVYVSSNDRALLVSRLVNRGPRRGESSLSPEQLDEAQRISEWTREEGDEVVLVDVTPVNRTRNFHNFSLETPEFFDDLFLRLTNEEIPNSRPVYQVQTADGTVYSVLTRGR